MHEMWTLQHLTTPVRVIVNPPVGVIVDTHGKGRQGSTAHVLMAWCDTLIGRVVEVPWRASPAATTLSVPLLQVVWIYLGLPMACSLKEE